MTKDPNQLAVNAIRVFSMDAIQKAASEHPGMPLGSAPLAWELFSAEMKHNPKDPQWINRDRFILSAGHASMLLYSLLYLFGYGLTKEDLENFRQFGSRTPGHPEYRDTPGVEMSTGPLGQGLATAVGFAMAEAHLGKVFNRGEHKVMDHCTFALTGDGCLEEGVSGEAASFAGTQKLDRLIVLYDRNQITIEGDIKLAFSEDVRGRYEAYGWQVLEVKDGNDLKEIRDAIEEAKANHEQPSLIIVNTKIAYGTKLEGSEKSHGSPLGDENIADAKKRMGWDEAPFAIPAELKAEMDKITERLEAEEDAWKKDFEAWAKEYPELHELWKRCFSPDFSCLTEDFFGPAPEGAEATRKSSGRILNLLAEEYPQFMGGSADLAPSNKTWLEGVPAFSPECREGRNVHFGIREFAMACMMNGMSLHGGLLPYCATFFVFSDYMKPAMRLSALMDLPVLYVCTHDSIGVGEDGPTHQPVEQLAGLRAIPNLRVFRPADYRECASCYALALEERLPAVMVLSRQGLPQLEASSFENAKKGAYIVHDSEDFKVILMGSGSEVALCLETAEKLEADGIPCRVLSVPCLERFLEQDKDYIESLLPKACTARLAVEAAHPMPWYRLTGLEGQVHGIERFGASAPAKDVFKALGFESETLAEEAKALL